MENDTVPIECREPKIIEEGSETIDRGEAPEPGEARPSWKDLLKVDLEKVRLFLEGLGGISAVATLGIVVFFLFKM